MLFPPNHLEQDTLLTVRVPPTLRPVTDRASRDDWLGGVLLCAHHAIPPACFGPALLCRSLGLEESTTARTMGWTSLRVAASLRRFERRCRALNLVPSIPPGRDFVIRYGRLRWLTERLAIGLVAGSHPEPGLAALAVLIDGLVDHPVAGSPDAHLLRDRIRRVAADPIAVRRGRYRIGTA